MTQQLPQVCAIVLNWNAPEDTIACVKSLGAASYMNLRIILVDNCSTDDSITRFRAELPDIFLMQQPDNGGYAKGNNAGIISALGSGADYVLIVNNDIEVERGFLEPLVAAAEADYAIGIVAPKILYLHDRTTVYAAGGRFSMLLCSGISFGNGEVDVSSSVAEELMQGISFASGCALLVRSDVFKSVGMLNERFFMYFEDLDFSLRVREKYEIAYVPASRVFHKCGAGVKWANYTKTYLYYHTRNRFWFFERHSILVRVYVVMFSTANALAKSIAIMGAIATENGLSCTERWARIKSLWMGFRDGIRGMPA
jgi:hypothetical protein